MNGIRNAPPPFFAQIIGNLHMLPTPTVYPIIASRNSNLPPHCPLSDLDVAPCSNSSPLLHGSCSLVIKLVSCSTQVSMKFILLINVKMPTIAGILTFTSMINTTSVSLKAWNIYIYSIFIFMSSINFMLSWVEHEKVLQPQYPDYQYSNCRYPFCWIILTPPSRIDWTIEQ